MTQTKGEKMKGMRRVELNIQDRDGVLLSELDIDALIISCADTHNAPTIIVWEDKAGWSCRTGLGSPVDGHYVSRDGCMESAAKNGYKFTTFDYKNHCQAEVILEQPDTIVIQDVPAKTPIFVYEDSVPVGVIMEHSGITKEMTHADGDRWQLPKHWRWQLLSNIKRIHSGFDTRFACAQAAIKDKYELYVRIKDHSSCMLD